jgi:predicted transcriptional regulator
MKLKKVSSKIWDIKKNVKVKDIMSKKSFSLEKNEKVVKAIKLMTDESISAIVILDNKKPIGIVTERDLIKKVLLQKDAKKLKISEVMRKDPKKSLFGNGFDCGYFNWRTFGNLFTQRRRRRRNIFFGVFLL